MSIATEVDALALRYRCRDSALLSGVNGFTHEAVLLGCRRGGHMHAQAVTSAIRHASETIRAAFAIAQQGRGHA